MSLLHPTEARLCNSCGNAWYAQARYSPLKPGAILFNAGQNAALAHSRNKYEQHKFCPRCGSDNVRTVPSQGFVPTAAHYGQAGPVNVNVNVNTGSGAASFTQAAGAVPPPSGSMPWQPYRPPVVFPPAPAATQSVRWWKSPRFWYFALPFATGGFASFVPPLWVASKVHEGRLRARLYVTAAAAAVLALIGGVTGGTPEDSTVTAAEPRDDAGVGIMLIAIAIGTGTAIVHRQRVFPTSLGPTGAEPTDVASPLPGVEEARARRKRRAEYRSLAVDDVTLAREMRVGRPDLTPAFDDGGLVDLNALGAADLERHARVTAAEAASIVSTRERLGRLSSVDELVVHGDLTLEAAERLRDYAVFIG